MPDKSVMIWDNTVDKTIVRPAPPSSMPFSNLDHLQASRFPSIMHSVIIVSAKV
jgi:hypothetical protein